jgi:hypothetical protein
MILIDAFHLNTHSGNRHLAVARRSVFIALILVAQAGCNNRGPETGETPDKNSAEITETTFTVPEHNQLTEQQVQQYLAVKDTEKEILSSQKKNLLNNTGDSDIMRYQDIEVKAAQINQLSLPEYEWIKNTVINSRIQAQFQEYFALNQQIISLLEGTLKRHEATKKDLKDADEIAILDGHVKEINEHIETLKTQIEKYTNLSESEKHNIEIVNKFRVQLEAVEKDQLSSQKINP